MINKADLVEIIEHAFKPLRCEARLHDFNSKISFVLELPDGELVERENLSAETLTNKGDLEFIILNIRAQIEDEGTALEPWTLRID